MMAKSIASSYVASSHKSFASSILKTPSLHGSRSDPGNRVRFKLPSDLQSVLIEAANNGLAKQYLELVYTIKNCEIKDGELSAFLLEVRHNIAMLDKSLYRFVEALLMLKWASRSQHCSMEYGEFLIDLLSTHNYYTKRVLETLVATFISEESYITGKDGLLTEGAKQCCNNVHNVLEVILRLIPMASCVLYETIRRKYPYFRCPAAEHLSYVSNILRISQYYPELQSELFHLVIERLIILDVNVPKTELNICEADCPSEAAELAIFEMEELNVSDFVKPVAQSLDVTLLCVFQYIHSSCHSAGEQSAEIVWDRTFQIYNNLILDFHNLMLPTDSTHHVQFLLFYLCSFNRTLLGSFLDYLWDKALREQEDTAIRQRSVGYLAGMVVRAKFVSTSIAQCILAKMAAWIHSYIDCQDKGFVLPELRRHPMFYAVCQALFYLVAFRHGDLLHPKQNLEFVLKLNVAKMVSSQLNPLRVCLPEIIENFVHVANTYQLAYCDPIIERNSRNEFPIIHHNENGTVANPCIEKEILVDYFPFDSFMLPRSKHIIGPLYREYERVAPPSQTHAKKCEDDNDFMNEQLPSSVPNMLTRLSVSESQEDCTTDFNMSFR